MNLQSDLIGLNKIELLKLLYISYHILDVSITLIILQVKRHAYELFGSLYPSLGMEIELISMDSHIPNVVTIHYFNLKFSLILKNFVNLIG